MPSSSKHRAACLRSSSCSMRHPFHAFRLDGAVVPVWVLGPEEPFEHDPGGGPQPERDAKALDGRLVLENGRHLVVDDFRVPVIGPHGSWAYLRTGLESRQSAFSGAE